MFVTKHVDIETWNMYVHVDIHVDIDQTWNMYVHVDIHVDIPSEAIMCLLPVSFKFFIVIV